MTADTVGSYTYNGAEQMKTVTQGANTYSYKYAGASQNEVLEQQKAGTTYQLIYGRDNQQQQPVVEQVKIGTSQTAYVENDPVTGQPLLLRTSTGNVSLYVYSGTGNPVGLLTDFNTQAFAYQYDPYGVPVLTVNSGGSGVPQNPFLFAGGIQDRATGWVHYGARWYNPTTGRWTQQDTLDNPLNPNNANRYAYAGNDPINLFDPIGLASQCATRIAVSGATTVVGGAIGYAGIAVSGTGVGAIVGGPLAAVGGVIAGVGALGVLAAALDGC